MGYDLRNPNKHRKIIHTLSAEEIVALKEDIKKAKPYPPDHPAVTIFDYQGPYDFERAKATLAKMILDAYYEEKNWEKDYESGREES